MIFILMFMIVKIYKCRLDLFVGRGVLRGIWGSLGLILCCGGSIHGIGSLGFIVITSNLLKNYYHHYLTIISWLNYKHIYIKKSFLNIIHSVIKHQFFNYSNINQILW